jgi:fimbrial chaperone protein
MYLSPIKSNSYLLIYTLLALLLMGAVLPRPVYSGSWRVIPIRIDMDQRSRSGVVAIVNDSEEAIRFSVEAREWTQDQAGKDLYLETSDILFFPKELIIDPNSERIIRTGIKVPATVKEKTYRLFIKQETAPRETPGTSVAIAIRFGVPIFAKPLNEQVSGEIVHLEVKDSKVNVAVKNSGNTHFRIQALKILGKDVSGASILSQELNGGYLLNGSEKEFTFAILGDICTQLNVMDIEVVTDRMQINGKADVDRAMCLTP